MANDTMKCYWRSYVDGDVEGYSISGDFIDNTNMLDRNKNTYAATDGANDDTTTVNLIFDMTWEREVEVFVLKSNLTEFYIQYWDGAAYQNFSPAVSYVANTSEFLIITLPSVQSTSRIKIVATKTIVADEEKKIYLFEITKELTELNISDLSISQEWRRKSFDNIYKGNVQVFDYPNYPKVDINIKLDNLTSTEYTAYKALKDHMLIDSYNVYIYYSDDYDLLNDEAYYLVNDISEFDSDPEAATLSAGISGILKLKEV